MEGKIPRPAERKPGSGTGMLSVHRPVLRDLTVLAVLARPLNQPLLSPFPHGPLGLGEGLLEGVLLGVHLLVEELRCQLGSIVDLDLRPGAANGGVSGVSTPTFGAPNSPLSPPAGPDQGCGMFPWRCLAWVSAPSPLGGLALTFLAISRQNSCSTVSSNRLLQLE